jgi:hypothetical protein
MISFKEFITEGIRNKAFFFDLDDTLIHHDPHKIKIHVIDSNGNRVRSLTTQEFNKHKLPLGHKYDFGEFKSAKVLRKSGTPIRSMINRLNKLRQRGNRTEILTARSDLDDKLAVKHHLKRYGIDIDKTHLRRAGNVEGTSTGDRKRRVLSDLIKRDKLKEVHLYDDDEGNHKEFAKLKLEHPDVKLYSHLVKHNPYTRKTIVVTTRH